MLPRVILTIVMVSAPLWPTSAQEIVSALKDEEIPGAKDITGFHSVQDKANKLELRVLEADASADVARNPVALFLVITDDAPGNEAQTYVWRFPKGVSVVKKLSATKSGLRILAVVDGPTDERTGRVPLQNEIVNVSYEFAKGVLSDKIRITTSHP
jgi:hypothetical protein